MDWTRPVSAGTRWRELGLSRRGLDWFLVMVTTCLSRLPSDKRPDDIARQVKQKLCLFRIAGTNRDAIEPVATREGSPCVSSCWAGL